jgi:hypothetical protein
MASPDWNLIDRTKLYPPKPQNPPNTNPDLPNFILSLQTNPKKQSKTRVNHAKKPAIEEVEE